MQDLQRMEHRQSDQKQCLLTVAVRAGQSCDRRTQKQCNRTLYRRKFYRRGDLCSGKDQPLVRVELKVDWKEIGKDIIPVLTWQTPLSYQTDAFRYDVPAGSIVRRGINNDVPGLR